MRLDWWSLDDDELFRQCAFDRYRASGPGGQKRNKTESAVRLRHLSTGVMVTAADSRSQHLNRRRALDRLRAALAYSIRQPISDGQPSDDVLAGLTEAPLHLPPRDRRFLPTAAWVLDVFYERQARLAETAIEFGVSTGRLVGFFESSPDCWQAANRIRTGAGQKPLRAGG